MIREVIHINVNVTDAKASIAFYQKLGFSVMHAFGDHATDDPSEGMDFGSSRMRGAVMSLSDHPRAATKIELIEWVKPKALPQPQPQRALHAAGVSRIALRTVDLLQFVERLKSVGIVFEQEPMEIDLVGAKRFALFRDPDGTLLELIEF